MRRRFFETLEDRRLLFGASVVEPVFAPGTPQEYVDEVLNNIHGRTEPPAGVDHFQFQDANRWGATAINPGPLNQGDPTALTWSIVADGTPIPALGGIAGESAAASNLRAFLVQRYGGAANGPADQQPWFQPFQSMVDRWGELSGLTFIYEPNDDGAPFAANNNNPGVQGVRADMRIGGHPIDGPSNVLAYNFFPDIGEMVVDTADTFYDDISNNSLGLRNVLGHEFGHGLGFDHVLPTDSTKLMEPFVSLSFDGPQHDDILAAHRGYGDDFEPNDTQNQAHDLGQLDASGLTFGSTAGPAITPQDAEFVSIDDASDVDFFSFDSTGGVATITLTPVGFSYQEGPDDGSTPSTFNSATLSNLDFEVLDINGTVIGSANSAGTGQAEMATVSIADGTSFIRVTGADAAVQMYTLNVTIGGEVGGEGGISGVVYHDRNGDGARVEEDGEEGLEGWTVYVDENGDNQWNSDEPAVLSDKNGKYSLSVGAGDATIRLIPFSGWTQTAPDPSALGSGGEHNLTGLSDGEARSGIDFGNWRLQANNSGTDWGDAPLPYPTLLSEGGAVTNVLPGFMLGSSVDGEDTPIRTVVGTDAGGNTVVTGGDNSDRATDHDGINFLSDLVPGGVTPVQVTAQHGFWNPGYLQGWIDFNADGDWSDPGEHVFQDVMLPHGTTTLSFTTPTAATPTDRTYARFRYGWERGISFTGESQAGEIEDYNVAIVGSVPPNPQANPDTFNNILQGSAGVPLNVLNNDVRGIGGAIVVSRIISQPGNGVVQVAGDGLSVLYTPQPTFSGTDTFIYEIRDVTGLTSQALVTVNVVPESSTGTLAAVDDSFDISQNIAAPFPLNVLANDKPGADGFIDPNNPAQRLPALASFSNPLNGIVSRDDRGTATATDDLILYTPNLNHPGEDQLQYTIQDQAGNTSIATVTIHVTPNSLEDDKVRFVLETLDLSGNPVEDVAVGSQFLLRASVEDIRTNANELGVFAAFMDVLYDSNLARPVADGTNPLNFAISFDGPYGTVTSGSAITPGLLDEVGAIQGGANNDGTNPLGGGLHTVFTVRMEALSRGTVQFKTDPADVSPFHDSLLFDPVNQFEDPLGPEDIRFENTSLIIGSGVRPTAVDDFIEVARAPNGNNTVLDVLANDIVGNLDTKTILSVQSLLDATGAEITPAGSVARSSDGLSIIYTPPIGFSGIDRFAYTFQNGNGITSTANVTVSVVPDASTDVVGINLTAVNLTGAPFTGNNIPTNTEFYLVATVDDLRFQPPNEGVFAAYMDVLYDANLLSVLPANNGFGFDVTFGPDYQNAPSGSAATPGVINEIGAVQTNQVNPTGPGEFELFRVKLRTGATPGQTDVFSDPADVTSGLFPGDPEHDTLLFERTVPGPAVDADEIRFGKVTLTIGTGVAPIAVDDSFFNAGTLDVLANDVVTTVGDTRTIDSVGTAQNGTVSHNGSMITYTPNAGFAGVDQFLYTMSGSSGFSSSATVTVTVDPKPVSDLVDVQITFTDSFGTPVTSVNVGDTFTATVSVADVSAASEGVGSFYMDLLYNAGLISIAPGANIQFGSDFSGSRTGSTTTPGIIDEVGAAEVNINSDLGPGFFDVFSIQMRANQAGTAIFKADPANIFPESDTHIQNPLEPAVPISQIGFVETSLIVSPSAISFPFANARNQMDVNDDDHVTPVDALMVIQELQDGGARSLSSPADSEGEPSVTRRRYIDTNRDNKITAADALNVIQYLNRRSNQQRGESEPSAAPVVAGVEAVVASVATESTPAQPETTAATVPFAPVIVSPNFERATSATNQDVAAAEPSAPSLESVPREVRAIPAAPSLDTIADDDDFDSLLSLIADDTRWLDGDADDAIFGNGV